MQITNQILTFRGTRSSRGRGRGCGRGSGRGWGRGFIVVVVVRVSSLLQKSCLQQVFGTLTASAQNYNLFGKKQ